MSKRELSFDASETSWEEFLVMFMLQVEREGLGPAPCYILLWDRKIPHVGEHKNEARIDEKTCCHCSFVVVPVRD